MLSSADRPQTTAQSADVLQQMVLDLIAQLDASEREGSKRRTCFGSYSPPEVDAAASRSLKNNWLCSKPNSKLRV